MLLSCTEDTEQNTIDFFEIKRLKFLIPSPRFTYFCSDSTVLKQKEQSVKLKNSVKGLCLNPF